MEQKNTFLSCNALFGAFVGLSFIGASLVYYFAGKSLNANPQLGNIFFLLTIAGVFIGIRRYREEHLGGAISYSLALGTGTFIVAVAAALYGIYLYILYSSVPELTEQYLATMNFVLEEVYKGSPLLGTMQEMMSAFVSPTFIAVSEMFNKLFTGILFTLLIALLLKRRRPVAG